MLQTLKTVLGAVAPKALQPWMTHFYIGEGRIYGTNGRVAIEAPLDLGIHPIVVPAHKFTYFCEACGTPTLKVDGTKIKITAKGKRFQLPLMDPQSYQFMAVSEPQEYLIVDSQTWLDAIRRLHPFVSTDATRPWAMSLLFQDGYAYATDNITLARAVVKETLPRFSIPGGTAERLLSITQKIRSVKIGSNIIVEYDNGWRLWSVVHDEQWPDVSKMFSGVDTAPPIPAGMKAAVEVLRNADPDKLPVIIFDGKVAHTREGEICGEIELEGEVGKAAFHAKPILNVLENATHLDLSTYPKPCPWRGAHLEGVIIGVRT